MGPFHWLTAIKIQQGVPYMILVWNLVILIIDLTTIGSDNGLSPGRSQAIIWTNPGILLIWPLGTNFREISIEILPVLFKKMH